MKVGDREIKEKAAAKVTKYPAEEWEKTFKLKNYDVDCQSECKCEEPEFAHITGYKYKNKFTW